MFIKEEWNSFLLLMLQGHSISETFPKSPQRSFAIITAELLGNIHSHFLGFWLVLCQSTGLVKPNLFLILKIVNEEMTTNHPWL